MILFHYLSICSILLFNSLSEGKNISISINTYKILGNRVCINLQIQNKDINPVYFYSYFKKNIQKSIEIYLFFEIYHNGKLLLFDKKRPMVKLPNKDDFVRIDCNEIYSEIIEISKYYPNDSNKGWINGNYKIKCYYKYTHNKKHIYGKILTEMEVVSNTLFINKN